MKLFFHITVTALLLVWLSGIFIEMLMQIFPGLVLVYPFADFTFSKVCHQQEVKLINFTGGHTLTCARCTGIYFGAFAVSISLFFYKIKNQINYKYFLFAIVLIIIDIALYNFHLYNYSPVISFSTGAFLGSLGFYYFYNGLNEYFSNRNYRELN